MGSFRLLSILSTGYGTFSDILPPCIRSLISDSPVQIPSALGCSKELENEPSVPMFPRSKQHYEFRFLDRSFNMYSRGYLFGTVAILPRLHQRVLPNGLHYGLAAFV